MKSVLLANVVFGLFLSMICLFTIAIHAGELISYTPVELKLEGKIITHYDEYWKKDNYFLETKNEAILLNGDRIKINEKIILKNFLNKSVKVSAIGATVKLKGDKEKTTFIESIDKIELAVIEVKKK